MGNPVTMLAISSAATGLQSFGKVASYAAEERALENQKAQAHIQAAEQSISDTRKLESVMSAQAARLGASGTSPLSTSFISLQKNSFQDFNQDQYRRKLQLDFVDSSIKSQERSNEIGTYSDIASQAIGFATGTANTMNINSGAGKAASFSDFNSSTNTGSNVKGSSRKMFNDDTNWSLF